MKADYVRYMGKWFGISREVFRNYTFRESGEKVYIMSPDIANKDVGGLRIRGAGIVFGRFFKNEDKFKPTTNILQIFGKFATKNVVELTDKEKGQYLRGFDIEREMDAENGYVIVKHGQDVLGCGLYVSGSLKNQIPKAKRLPPEK
ncbi:MAG: methyltransferase RsmF C-terminal domain-like protein [Candidatus Aenigmatarchaeota archaeon]